VKAIRALLALFILAPLGDARPALAAGKPLEIHFLDVGQGDAAVIIAPSGKMVLIDAGPPEAEGTVTDFLKAHGSGPLEAAIMTHPHLDHMGGLLAALKLRGAKHFYDPVSDHPSPALTAVYTWVRQETAAGRLVAHRASTPDTRPLDLGDGVKLEFIGPDDPPIKGSRSDVNANSIICRLSYGPTVVLFEADAEAESEARLLANHKAVLPATVLKVAHHGSRHSSHSDLLAAVKPKYAVVSAGVHNDYGHPSAEAISRLESVGAKVFRTDTGGEIVVRASGTRVDVTAEGKVAASSPAEPHGKRETTTAAGPEAGGYLGSARSNVFHRMGCENGQKIKEHNRIFYAKREDAIANGREPAKDCNP
jgi:beta-lactamase superfamily II metal-dependent hydrolase